MCAIYLVYATHGHSARHGCFTCWNSVEAVPPVGGTVQRLTIHCVNARTSHKCLVCKPPPAGELDFQADEAFLEAMMAFVLSIPAADVWQDDAWEARQRRLLTAQFGPNEVRD